MNRVLPVALLAMLVATSCQRTSELLVPPVAAQAAAQAAARSEYGASIAALLGYLPPDPDVVVAIDMRASADVLVAGAPVNGHEDAAARVLTAMLRTGMLMVATSRTSMDPFASDALVVGVWIDEESVVAIGGAELVTMPLADGADPISIGRGEIRAARRGPVAIVGMGTRLDQAVARAATTPTWEPGGAWPDGWDAMPGQPVAWMWASPWDALMREPSARGLVGAMRDAGVQRVMAAVGTDGSAVVAVAAQRADTVESWFGAVPAGLETYFEQRIEGNDQATASWMSYQRLLVRGMLSRYSLDRSDGVVTLSLAAPMCEGSWRQSAHVLGFIGAAAALDELDLLAPAPWSLVDVPLAETCDVAPPGDGVIDTRWLSVPGGHDEHLLMMLDASWAVRAFGASPGGLLGVPLDADAVAQAQGDAPMGIDPTGTDALLMYAQSNGAAIAAPEAFVAALPYPWRSRAQAHDTWGTIVTFDDDVPLPEGDAAAPWNAYPELVRADVPFALAISGELVRELADDMIPRALRGGGVYALAANAQGAVITLDTERRPVVRLITSADPEEAQNNLSYLLASLARTAAGVARLPEPQTALLVADIGRLAELMQIESAGDGIVDIVFDVDGHALLVGAGLPLVALSAELPALAWQRELGPAEWELRNLAAAASSYWESTASATGVRRFPASTGPSPALDALAARCLDDAAPDVAGAYDETGWTELGRVPEADPFRFVYQFESSGTDAQAEFTATAFGDLDCDGEVRTMRVYGNARNGWVDYDWDIAVDDASVY